MRIGIIDADLIGRKNHRFPNLVSMKISNYYKNQGNKVVLCDSYSELDKFDRVFISKVFTDTVIPENIIDRKKVRYGGSGFF